MTATEAIEQAITDIGALFTGMLGWMGDVFELFLSEPILVIMLGFTLVSFAVGLVVRLMKKA